MAEASLRISIEAISPGGGGVAPGNPSTTYNGSLPALIEVPPRIRIRGSAPGSPLLLVTVTPAARPCSACVAPRVGNSLSSAAETDDIEPVTSLFFWTPYPTTTSSESDWISCISERSITDRFCKLTSSDVKPTDEKTSVTFPSGTDNWYRPSTSVTVPVVVFFIITFTPGSGSSVVKSFTVPLTVKSWA